jgi:hypothetical protein
MSLQRCNYDDLQAVFLCATHQGFYCLKHYAEHTSDHQLHNGFKVQNVLTQESFRKLETEIYARIKELQKSKVKITKKASNFIKKIEELCASNLEELDQEIRQYLDYGKDNNFDSKTFEIVKTILETEETFKINIRDYDKIGEWISSIAGEERRKAEIKTSVTHVKSILKEEKKHEITTKKINHVIVIEEENKKEEIIRNPGK